MKNYIGIDVGGTAVKGGIVRGDGVILYKNKFNASFDNYKTPLISTAMVATKAMYDHAIENQIAIEGIAFSITGDVDVKKNIIVGGCGSIPEWENIDVEEQVAKTLGKKMSISVVNDANSAAIAEKWLGNAQKFDDAIIYTIGTGIGGGIFVDGKILNGYRGFAGNIGHMTIDSGSEMKCPCGNFGCYEKLASTKNLLSKCREVIPEIVGEDIFKVAEYNEKIFQIVDKFFEYHGIALGSLIHIFNPQAIIIGGGISNEGEWFINRIKEETKKKTIPHFFDGVQFLTAKLTNDAGIIGACKFYIDLKEK